MVYAPVSKAGPARGVGSSPTGATNVETRCLKLTVDEVALNGRASTALKALDVQKVTGSSPVFVANKQRGFKKASRKMT